MGAATFAIATVGINIVANFVSSAYDFSNVAHKYISFQRGGLITAVLSLLVMPWNLYSSPVVINYFLGGLGALLGPLFGIIIADYFLIKRRSVEVVDLYRWGEKSRYWFQGGINLRAVWAFFPATVIAVVIALVPTFGAVSPFSWCIGAGLAGALYWIQMARTSSEGTPKGAEVR